MGTRHSLLRQRKRKWAYHVLKDSGIEFESLEDGCLLRIGTIDFWPSRMFWKDHNSGKLGKGMEELIEYVKGK